MTAFVPSENWRFEIESCDWTKLPEKSAELPRTDEPST
jgi:hypothetical protein